MPTWIFPALALTLMPLVTLRVFGRQVVERMARTASWEKQYLRSLRAWNGLVPVWVEAEAELRDSDR